MVAGRGGRELLALITVALITVLFLTASFIVLAFDLGPRLRYNAKLSGLGLKKNFKFEYIANEPADREDYEIYRVSSGKPVPKFARKVAPADWSRNIGGNSISQGMMGIDGAAKFKDKEVILKIGLTYNELVLAQSGKRKTLESVRGLWANLGLGRVYWLSDGKHLVIEQNNKIGLYNIDTRKYALLAKGELSKEVSQ